MIKVRLILLTGLLVMVGMAGCRSAHTTSAILYIDEQNYDKAVQVIHEGFEYRDDEPDAYYYLGEAYSHLAEEAVENDDYPEASKNYTLAYDAYQRVLDIDREHWEDRVGESLAYNYRNRFSQAGRDWEEGFFEQAEGHLRLAYAAAPDSLTPVKNIARMKMQMAGMPDFEDRREEMLDEALVLLDQVLATKPEAYELQADKATVLFELGRNEEAGAIYDQLLQEHGDDTALLLSIAELSVSDGNYSRAADMYVRVVDLRQGDTDALNDDQNKDMLVYAGRWYGISSIGRYDDALAVLDRAADLELFPTEETMLIRLQTFYNYGKKLKNDAAAETDLAQQAEVQARSQQMYQRAVDVGIAMTNTYMARADGFLYLSMAQLELGDYTASEANFKTYEELEGSSGN